MYKKVLNKTVDIHWVDIPDMFLYGVCCKTKRIAFIAGRVGVPTVLEPMKPFIITNVTVDGDNVCSDGAWCLDGECECCTISEKQALNDYSKRVYDAVVEQAQEENRESEVEKEFGSLKAFSESIYDRFQIDKELIYDLIKKDKISLNDGGITIFNPDEERVSQ